MAAHPGLSGRRFGNRLLAVFNREDLPDSRLYTFYTDRYLLLRAGLLPFWLVAAFGLVGSGLSLPRRRFLFVNLVTGGLTLFLALYFVFGRYRLPLLIPLSLSAAVAAAALRDAIVSRSGARAVVLAASLTAAILFCLAPLPGTARGSFPDRFNLAMAYYREGRLDQAERLFQELLAVRTEICYLKVLELNPREIQASRGLLQAYQKQGKGRETKRLVHALQQRAGDAGDPGAP